MAQATALGVQRFFTEKGKNPYNLLDWTTTDSILTNLMTGEIVFKQEGVEFPASWSVNAINIVTQKYFWGEPGTAERENSLKQLIDRVIDTIQEHGLKEDYFVDKDEAQTFSDELKYILATQRASFNSPVWFNIGAPDRAQQASACFILSVEDDMHSILNWYTEEGIIFKGGSGAGINLSAIRSSHEILSKSGGTASGPLSFMRGADASAGAIKSGGKTRRAAKMVILDVDHPDIEEFIWSKALEERKARALEESGFDMSLNGKDSFSIQYQNANNSVRVTDEFMQAVLDDKNWDLKAITTGKTIKTLKARDVMQQFSEAAWECADPGMQFDTLINKWNPTPNAGRINGSNPCSEYMHLDDSACNLASLNLLKYLDEDGRFDIEAFEHVTSLMFTAQEILVSYSSYPTKRITKNAKAYRELGIGYANLGALLMAKGLPYDSEEGRAFAAAITSLLTGHSYAVSAKMAKRVGPFAGFNKDRKGMLKVLQMHRDAVSEIDASYVPEDLLNAATMAWNDAVKLAEKYGTRNAQASVLAPTGTIGLAMDCDTTGVEPDLGLVKTKNLVGGGTMSIVNQTVPRALKELGYTRPQVKEIVDYIDEQKTIVGAPHLKDEHLSVFACSMGDNTIHYLGHVKMMAAVQPFLSGAISKTVNLPEDVSVEDIEQLHIDAWKMGLKAVAIYRDNCKLAQPLSTTKKDNDKAEGKPPADTRGSDTFEVRGVYRKRLPKARTSRTYEFRMVGIRGFFTIGEYQDASPGELFIEVAKQGSTLSGLMDSFARSVSYGLQYGVPLKAYVKGMTNTTFAPSGVTDDPDVKTATSLMDYIFRRLALDYLSFDDRLELGLANIEDIDLEDQASLLNTDIVADIAIKPQTRLDIETTVPPKPVEKTSVDFSQTEESPLCMNCGNRTQRSGSCYVCPACGTTTGCS